MTTTLDLEALLESLPDGVLVADADGRYVYANQAGLELLGYGLDELRSMKVSDLLDTSPEWPGIDLRNLTEGRSWRGRVGLRRKGGGTVLVELVAAILPGPEGNLSVTSVRPIGPRPWREATSAVQYAVAEILAQARTGEEAAPRLLEALAEEIGWDTAEFWVVEEDGEHLRCVGVWSTPELAEFERVTRTMLLTRGAPLPGTVWETEAPMWIEDGLASMPFVRQGIAVQHGLSSACAVPVRAPERGIVGVLAFFARGVRREDPELLRALEPLTAQVGHFLHRRLTEQALAESRDQLQAILGGIEDGITVQAPDGSLSFANQGAARALGFETPEELLAMPVPELMTRFQVLDEEGGPFPLERLPGRRALQGERNAAELVRFRVVATGEERWSYVSASPVVDERGEVRFAINIFRDVTERRRIEEGQRFLGEASAILASSLHYQTTLRSVAELAVSRLADWCVVFIQEEGELRQLQVAHADPAMTPIVEEIQRRYPFSERRSEAILEVAGTGRSLLVPEITDDALAASAVDEEHLQALRGLGFRSAIVVPMRSADRTLGVIVFVSSGKGRRYDERDLELAEELGRRAAVAVDHARVHDERGHVAGTLQRSLLPPETPAIPGFEVATRYRPALHEIAGDFYDAFPMGDGTWAVMIGDVCGKGAEAAALTAAARYTVHAAAIEHREPTSILSVLNEALLRQDLDGRFCTLLFATVRPTPEAAEITLATGGHPPAFILRGDGSVRSVEARGTLLGAVEDPSIGQERVLLRPGDSMVLYTDGLTDSAGVDPGRISAELGSAVGRSAEQIADALEAMATTERERLRDDLAILVLRVLPARR